MRETERKRESRLVCCCVQVGESAPLPLAPCLRCVVPSLRHCDPRRNNYRKSRVRCSPAAAWWVQCGTGPPGMEWSKALARQRREYNFLDITYPRLIAIGQLLEQRGVGIPAHFGQHCRIGVQNIAEQGDIGFIALFDGSSGYHLHLHNGYICRRKNL